VDAYFKDPKFITKQYVLFVLVMASITFVIGDVFVGKDFNGYAKSEIHYVEMNDNAISKLEEIESLEKISVRYYALTEKRNAINHGGFTDKGEKSSKFKDALSKNYEELKKLL